MSYLLFTRDGINYGNFKYYLSNGLFGWSKNVKTSGAILLTELNANNTRLTGNGIIEPIMASVWCDIAIYNNKIYTYYLIGTRDPTTLVITYTAAKILIVDENWNKTEIDFVANNRDVTDVTLLTGSARFLIWGNKFYIIVVYNNALRIYQSNDYGYTWFEKMIVGIAGYNLSNRFNINIDDTEGMVFITTNDTTVPEISINVFDLFN